MVDARGEGSRELQLADAAYEVFDIESLVSHLSAAIRAFTAEGDVRQGATTCARLGWVFGDFLGNATAARAWYQRATRLLENEPPCLEQGWVAVASLGCDVDDPDVLLANAELALDRARQFGDVNLERVLELAPGAQLVTHGFSALRMSTWWPVPMDRVRASGSGYLARADARHHRDRARRRARGGAEPRGVHPDARSPRGNDAGTGRPGLNAPTRDVARRDACHATSRRSSFWWRKS